ncbi:MAG: cupin domain-containing protein [Thermovirgaceae bacterium]|nr:cupin domain-containing protein [Synergistales bacterium]
MDPSGNLFFVPEALPDGEVFEDLLAGPSVRIERILSSGQATPPGTWLDQDDDEWVALLQGEATLEYEDSSRVDLRAGDWLFIPARRVHRVASTSSDPACLWLAVHGKLS